MDMLRYESLLIINRKSWKNAGLLAETVRPSLSYWRIIPVILGQWFQRHIITWNKINFMSDLKVNDVSLFPIFTIAK